jgi:hypothetical protein
MLRDTTGLFKIEEQRMFVAWWKVSVNDRGAAEPRATRSATKDRVYSEAQAKKMTGMSKQRVSI